MDNRELKQWQWRRQQQRQKSNRFRMANQQLYTCITLFCTFLCRHCSTTTWNFRFHVLWRTWTRDKNFQFLFLNLNTLPQNKLQKNSPNLTNWLKFNKSNKVWNNANSLFKWGFHCRCRRGCLSSLIGTLRSEDGDGRENVAEKVNSRSFNIHCN